MIRGVGFPRRRDESGLLKEEERTKSIFRKKLQLPEMVFMVENIRRKIRGKKESGKRLKPQQWLLYLL